MKIARGVGKSKLKFHMITVKQKKKSKSQDGLFIKFYFLPAIS